MIYLKQNPGWKGKGVLVEKNRRRGKLIIPDLAMTVSAHLRKDLPLNSELEMTLKGVNLPELEPHFLLKPV